MSGSHSNRKGSPIPSTKRFRLHVFPAALALALILPVISSGALQDGDDEVVRVDADLVVLNVTVTNAEGQFVHKIPRSEFKVFEDGREQTINTFSLEETPFAAAILLDTSGSMEGRVSLARAAAIRFLDGMREDDVAAIYNFDTKVEQVQDFSAGRDLPPMAYGLKPKGMTALNDAIVRAAVDLSKRPEKRRAIVVLSDGEDTHSGATQDRALANALAANATIYTVDMADLDAPLARRATSAGALKNYASKSGGRYVPSPGGRALSDAFAAIVAELSNQYTIGYQPTNRTRDGRWRAIEIRLARPNLAARTRRGYKAQKS